MLIEIKQSHIDLLKNLSLQGTKLTGLKYNWGEGDDEEFNAESGQWHKLAPATWEDVQVGDIVYCKVNGRFYTHLVKAKNDERGCQIGNNKGNINGWTKQVYGKVIEVL